MRFSGPMIVLGLILAIDGVIRMVNHGVAQSAGMLAAGLIVLALAGFATWYILRSTMHIVELDERDARSEARRNLGGDTGAGA